MYQTHLEDAAILLIINQELLKVIFGAVSMVRCQQDTKISNNTRYMHVCKYVYLYTDRRVPGAKYTALPRWAICNWYTAYVDNIRMVLYMHVGVYRSAIAWARMGRSATLASSGLISPKVWSTLLSHRGKNPGTGFGSDSGLLADGSEMLPNTVIEMYTQYEMHM
jgi:hypothetical protein